MTTKQAHATALATKAAAHEPTRLTAESSEVELRAALARQPGLPHATLQEANLSQQRINQSPHWPAAELGVAAFWSQALWHFQATMPRTAGNTEASLDAAAAGAVAALRIALDARDALRGLEADLPLLNHGDLLVLRGQLRPAEPAAAAAMLAAIIAKGPGLSAWQARRQAAGEAAQAVQEQHRAQQSANAAAAIVAQRIEAARALLRRLAGEGIRLEAAGQDLFAQPAVLLTAADRAAAREYRAELVAMLLPGPEIIAGDVS